MARLFRNQDGFEGGKYLVQRRDGTVPDWPYFVIGAADPCASSALMAYAWRAEQQGLDPQYVADIRELAREFDDYLNSHPQGDPDAPRHRQDDPEIVAKLKNGA